MQVHTLSAAVHTIFIYDSCSVGTDTTSCTLLTSAHDMVAVIADNETTENIIVLFPALDVDFEKSLHIKEKVTVDDSRTIIFIVTKLTDVFRICEHIFETGSRTDKSELTLHVPECHAQVSGLAVVLEDSNGGRSVVIRYKVFIYNLISERG